LPTPFDACWVLSQEVVSEQPQRFFVTEIIREKIFLMYDHEVPYCTQVSVRR
jgi:GTP-binding protein Era